MPRPDAAPPTEADALREQEARVLEMVAGGESLENTLVALTRFFEAQTDGMLASILLINEAGRIYHAAAPSLPAEYLRQIDGELIGPDRGSCGTAAYLKQPVIVSDIATDPRWALYRDVALGFGLRACWSVPIFGPGRLVLGTFALYYKEPREPEPEMLDLAAHASRLAAIAIQHHSVQEELRESEAGARLIIENALDANVTMNSAGIVTGWTARAAALFGWSKGEAIGRPLSSLIIPERMRQRHEAGLRHYLASGEGPILNRRLEIDALHKDGHEFPVQLAVTAIRRGERVYFSAFLEDVTERKRMEEEIRQLQKLEAIGRLTAGIAHDFNNLLGVIVGVGNLLLPDLKDPEQRAQVEEMVKAGERGAGLTRQFVAFSRMQILQPEVLDLGEVVASLEPMLRRLIRGNIALQTAAAPELWPVAADRSQLEQVVMNLVVNARDAMPPPAGGTLRIEAANAELPQDYPESHPGIVPGPYVSLAVSDTGQGMDEATRKRVFEPFFTTKELGKGTGLGLATVYGIVKQSGGYITVQSAPGQGACFKVFLPRAIPPLAARVPVQARKPEPVDPGHLHVLLVEDEPALRRALELMLRRQGCQVTVASGGAEALRLIEQGGVVPNFLLTDLVMPEMSGDLLAERVRELFPGIPVLPMSGYVDDSVLHGPMLGPGAPFLQKPFTSLELADAIREAIQAAPRT